MRISWTSKHKLIIHMLLVVSILGVAAVLFIPKQGEGFLLLFLMIFLFALGIFSGPIIALSTVLIFYFLIGSTFFWAYLTNAKPLSTHVSHFEILLWAIFNLFIAITSGYIAIILNENEVEKRQLKERIETLVSVDPITGFDNEHRMYVELESEFSRAKRYQTPFVFLIMKINYLDQFQKLYGEKEYLYLLQHIAKEVFRLTRLSDNKFRFNNQFAFILTNTPMDQVQVVIEKLKKELSVYQLQNKKNIHLTLSFGYSGYSAELASYDEILDEAREQVLDYGS